MPSLMGIFTVHNQFTDILLASFSNIVSLTVLCYKAFLMFKLLYVGTPGSLQPHPPEDRVFDKLGSKKLRVCGAGRERLSSSGKLCALHLMFYAFVGI